MRKIISIIFGVLLIAGAVFIGKHFVEKNKKEPTIIVKKIKSVYTVSVENKDIPVQITASGNISAKNKIDLYSEVQGLLQPSRKNFKTGTSYVKGESILRINSEEFYANLQAQKSKHQNSIIAILPDILLDYPEEYNKWKKYSDALTIGTITPRLPIFSSDKEKYFVLGKGINTSYFSIKNLEVKLRKHSLRAPFNGVLTEALVTSGSLVKTGQKLGEFISTKQYELEVAISTEFIHLLKKGNAVALSNLEKTKTYTGVITRINGKVNALTQTLKVFIELADSTLKEGMYLEATLTAKTIKNAFEIDRKLLLNNKQIYIVKDSVLALLDVTVANFSAENAVVKNIPNGTILLAKPVPSSYAGMQVKTLN